MAFHFNGEDGIHGPHLQLCSRFLSDFHGIHKLLTMRIVLHGFAASFEEMA
jgi:hypothetical protein